MYNNDLELFLHEDTDGEKEEYEENEIEMLEESKNYLTPIHMIYKICHSTGLKDVFPTISIALSIALTLPVSSASPERAFSELKLIQTRLRSTMLEDRLEALMIMSCEKDIPISKDGVLN